LPFGAQAFAAAAPPPPGAALPTLVTQTRNAAHQATVHSDTPAESRYETNPWGSSIFNDPAELHRVFFQNLDGIHNSPVAMDLTVSSMVQFKVNTFCWADHGLNLADVAVSQALKRPIMNHFGMARSVCSLIYLPRINSAISRAYQPGGTFTATTGKWTTQSKGKSIVDPSGMGRWSGICFTGKRGKKLAIITAYSSRRQQHKGGFGFFISSTLFCWLKVLRNLMFANSLSPTSLLSY
jgi:hypothetical protein